MRRSTTLGPKFSNIDKVHMGDFFIDRHYLRENKGEVKTGQEEVDQIFMSKKGLIVESNTAECECLGEFDFFLYSSFFKTVLNHESKRFRKDDRGKWFCMH